MDFEREASIPIAFIIPHKDDVSFAWAASFATMQKPPGWILISNSGLTIAEARETMVESALSYRRHDAEYMSRKEETDQDVLEYAVRYIMFLDSDVIPPANVIYRFMSFRYPIVSGVYYKKIGGSPAPVMYVKTRTNEGRDSYLPVRSINGTGWALVDAVGLGCTLVDTRVFRRLSKPWFQWEHVRVNEQMHNIYPGLPERTSEDIYFCNKLQQELGIKVLVDPNTKCDHIGHARYGEYGMKALVD